MNAIIRFLSPQHHVVADAIEYVLTQRPDDARKLRAEMFFKPDAIGGLHCELYGHVFGCHPSEGTYYIKPCGHSEVYTVRWAQIEAFILAANW